VVVAIRPMVIFLGASSSLANAQDASMEHNTSTVFSNLFINAYLVIAGGDGKRVHRPRQGSGRVVRYGE
jgi:hypothetical protein